MAFYTSRVNDDGVEIERRVSARGSSRSFSSYSSRSISTPGRGQIKSVRFINSAVYTEKPGDLSDCSSFSEGAHFGRTSRLSKTSRYCHNSFSDDNLFSDDARLSENASFSEDGAFSESSTKLTNKFSLDCQTDAVPPLDIESEENCLTTPRDCTFSCRKPTAEVSRLVLKPDLAYDAWLTSKRKVRLAEAARRQEVEERKEREREQRKRLAEEKYRLWLEGKTHQSIIARDQPRTLIQRLSGKRPPIDTEEAIARRKAWEERKKIEDEQRRQERQREDQRRIELEEERRIMAAEAWRKWMTDVDKKPKPVPLNQGIFTLRGTISDLYVNPNEWKNVIPAQDE